MVMLHFKIEKKTDKKIVEYFGNLEKELLEGKLSWLLENLSCPVRFLFPSYEQIRLRGKATRLCPLWPNRICPPLATIW